MVHLDNFRAGGAMKIRIALLMALLVVPLASHAQAFKCRTPSGNLEFSDSPCAGGAQTERVQSSEYISPERQRQAREVHERNAVQVQGMEAENMAFRQQQQQRQQAAQVQSDTNQRSIESRQAAEKAQLDAATEKAKCIDVATKRRNSTMLAECKGISKVQAQNELDAPLSDNLPRPIDNQPMPVIKSCNGDTCRDQYGNRYTSTVVPGKFDRSDGKRCRQVGNALSCN